jgi:6-pyruvoyltetrahydropterin/6-carboxytetrahydropterin synthase
MYSIRVENSFDSAHFLRDYKGKCSNIHGHRWTVQVDIKSEELCKGGQTRGMVEDFSVVKNHIKEIIEKYDHSLIIEEGSIRKKTLDCLIEDGFKIITVDFRTTAENFARQFFKEIRVKGYNVNRVTVYETPVNSAVYEEL